MRGDSEVWLGVEALGEPPQHDGRAGVPPERAAAAQLLRPIGHDLAGKLCMQWNGHDNETWALLTWMSPLPDWTYSAAVDSASPGPSASSRSTSTSPVTVLRSR